MPDVGKPVVEASVIDVPEPPVPAVSSFNEPFNVENTCYPPLQVPVPQPNP